MTRVEIDLDDYPADYPIPDPNWYGEFRAVHGRSPTNEECWYSAEVDRLEHRNASTTPSSSDSGTLFDGLSATPLSKEDPVRLPS